jgi:hypothetical protein
MKMNRRTLLKTAGASTALIAAPGLLRAQSLPRNVRLVIGSTSTGGDTYQSASLVADALSAALGVNIRVDAVGTNEAYRALDRDPSGATLMYHHDQTYLGHLYGVEGYPDLFGNYKVGQTVAINPGNAYLVGANSLTKRWTISSPPPRTASGCASPSSRAACRKSVSRPSSMWRSG